MEENYTDEQIIKAAMRGTCSYYNNCLKTGAGFNLERCKSIEEVEVTDFLKSLRGESPFYVRIVAQKELKRLEAQIAEARKARIYALDKCAIAGRLRTTTAKVRLDAILQDSGLTYKVVYQKYRARLDVTLGSRGAVRLYIYYKDMLAHDMSQLPVLLNGLNTLIAEK